MVLAAVTLALAASTLYLARTLKAERAVRAASIGAFDAPIDSPRAAPAGNPALAPALAPTAPPVTADTALIPDDGQEAALRSRLDALNDPAARAARMASLKSAFAPMTAELARTASLRPQEEAQLLDFMAEATLRSQQRATECRLTPGCDLRAGKAAYDRSELQELERAVGADVVRRLEGAEARGRIADFAASLPASQTLPEAAASELASALADVWRREIDGSDPDGESARRLHSLAASVLTAEQLELFNARASALLTRD